MGGETLICENVRARSPYFTLPVESLAETDTARVEASLQSYSRIRATIQGREPENPIYEAAEVSQFKVIYSNNKAALPQVAYDLHRGRKHTSFESVRLAERLPAPANDGDVVVMEKWTKEEMKEDGAEDGGVPDRQEQ